MKVTNPSRSVVSHRELLALATFASVANAAPEVTAPQPAAAPQKDKVQTLDEIVVQAERERSGTYNPTLLSPEKMTAPLLDTPQTFTVIPEEVYKEQGARTLTDVLKNTPGISFNAGENGFGTGTNNFSMRGVSTAGSIFYDGVRDSGSYSRDVFNVERVEIAKGPAADFGRGTAGGYVNIVTKTPTLEDFYSGTTSYAFDETDASGRFRTSLDFNQHFENAPVEGTALRLNALFQEGGVAGRDFAEMNSWGIAPSLAFGLGTRSRAIFAFQHLEQNDIPDWGVPSGNSATGSGFGSVRHIGRDIYYGLITDYDDTVSDSFIARFEHDLTPGLTLTNQTRVSRTSRLSEFTMPYSFNNVAGSTVRQEHTKYDRANFSVANITGLTYEFRTGALEHTLAAGVEFMREESQANRYNSSNRSTSASSPISDPTGFPLLTYGGYGDVEINTAAIYAYDTVKLSEKWQLTGGFRAEYYDVELVDLNNTGVVGPNTFGRDETTLGGKLGLVYKPAENGSIYGAVGISALPPGSFLSNSDASRIGDNGFPGAGAGINSPDAKVQTNLNYELGTKWDFYDGRISTSLAVFRTERQDVAITGRAHNNGVPTVPAQTLTGYHEQIIQGIELGAAGKITEEWSIFGGMLIMDSERKVNPYWETARRLANTGDYNADFNSFDGDELAYTPNYTANLWTTYKLPVGVTLGGGFQYVSASYVGRPDDAERIIPNGRFGKLPDYVSFNALVAYDVTENVTVRLNVDNVLDDVYAVSSNWSGVRSNLGPPRTYTISADWTF